ncbi:hypothetical protein G4B88_009736 [Cannabis sativa]|uniref:Uncharacterized protein n=1 Tax=Cannabis sativa TaxID=3483 RepID=A0A7J6EG52_CANSA|nr:hypothetical protein G4B88_009736 [Cannabis sativa]
MEVKKNTYLWCLFLVLLWPSISSVAAGLTMVKSPNCETKCGDVEVPYPFGIHHQNCAISKDIDRHFLLNCSTTTTSTSPKLMYGGLEVTKIDVEKAIMSVKHFYSYDCYHRNGILIHENSPSIRLSKSFTLSDSENKLFAFGCDTLAFMNASRNNFGSGCISVCNENVNMSAQTSCSGLGCCQTSVPKHLKYLSVTTSSFNNHKHVNPFNPCGYAFLADQKSFNISKMRLDFMPQQAVKNPIIVVDWIVGNQTCEQAQSNSSSSSSSSYVCGQNTDCYYSHNGGGYQCHIDECSNPMIITNNCKECKNIPGSYQCKCPLGMHGDGKNGNCRGFRFTTLATGVEIALGILVLVFGTWRLYKFIDKRKEIKLKKKFFKRNGGLLLEQQIHSSNNNVDQIKLFDSKELEKATNQFSMDRILGQGGQGTVYKGMLEHGKIIAVKKSKIIDEAKLSEFINEVVILSQINHRNVVKLLGCCLETDVPLLVYEFIPNGTLSSYIHEQNDEFPFTWNMRLRIAIEVAGALSYLHSSASFPIYHRDIKSTNILLDEKLRAKVADFGTSRTIPLEQSHLTTLVYGTFGYLDPEYFQTSQFTDKSDVYSFGVVLVELLTGQKVISTTRDVEGRSLATHFLMTMKKNSLFDIIDAQVLKTASKEEILIVANLAQRCLHFCGKNRPTMREIVMELEMIQITDKDSKGSHYNNYEDRVGMCIQDEIVDSWNVSTSSTGLTFDGTKNNYLCCFFLVVLWPSSLAADLTTLKSPNCEKKCGDVEVPYPFGIDDENCAISKDIDEHFLLNCNTSSGSPKLIYGRNLEVTNIDVEKATMSVEYYYSYDCYRKNGSLIQQNRTSITLSKSFTLSDSDNKLFTFGCDTLAFMNATKNNFGSGCISTCNENVNMSAQTSCSGLGCCQTSVPKHLKYLSVGIGSLNNHTNVYSFNPCGYAFLVDQNSFDISKMRLDFKPEQVKNPIVLLDWVVGNNLTCKEAQSNSSSYVCGENSDCYYSENGGGYQCRCKQGYEGNPYLKQGCQVIGASIFLMIIVLLLFYDCKRRKREKIFKQNGGLVLKHQRVRIFTKAELAKATNNYNQSNFIGQGGFASVYKGVVILNETNSITNTSTQQIAVKKPKLEKDDQNKSIQINHQQFHEEIAIVSQVNHKNVVKLLGLCLETKIPLLVYELVPNGTLSQHIHAKGSSSSSAMLRPWKTRLRIATETALSIDYLHSLAQPPIIHRDIKSTNILLDENYTAKVSDFGASVLIPLGQTGIATTVQGTIGYLDPEYLTTSTLTSKSDVYSFGVVLVELITGEKPISNGVRRSGAKSNIIQYFVSTVRENKGEKYVSKIVDPNVVYEENHEIEIETVAELAMKCLEGFGERRPTMKEVAEELVWLNKGINKGSSRYYNNAQQNNEETNHLLIVDHGDQSSVMSNIDIKNKDQIVEYTTFDVSGYDGESSISLH